MHRYYQVNVLTKADGIDESRSLFDKWGPESSRPDKAGEFRTMYRLEVDPERVESAEMFRLVGWSGPLIVSERVKTHLEEKHVKGVKFEDVTAK